MLKYLWWTWVQLPSPPPTDSQVESLGYFLMVYRWKFSFRKKRQKVTYASKFKNIYLLYSDEDDKNIEKFTRFNKDFNTKDMYLKGYNHFDGYHRIYQIPELIDLINTLI